MSDTEAPTRIPDEPIGTGVADAAHPSTLPVLEIGEGKLDAEQTIRRDPPHQRCESSDATLTGCVRARLSGHACQENELGKYFLLEDDVLVCRPAMREACLCARHGKGYIMLIRNKRRSHAMCWPRGSLRGHAGEWLLERPRHMEQHFSGGEEEVRTDRKTLTPSQLQTKWGKMPAESEEPTSSSGTVSSMA